MKRFLFFLISGLWGLAASAQGPLVINVGYAPLPSVTADAGVDTLICEGASVQLLANGGGGLGPLTYSWQPTTGLDNPNIANPIATPASTTSYTVTVSDNRACAATDLVEVEVITCASVREAAQFGLRLYPNPASDQLSIRWDADYRAQEIRITDLRGRLLLARKPDQASNNQLIGLNDLPAGLYLVHIYFNAAQVVEKLIIQ